jgi:hypothetical protein
MREGRNSGVGFGDPREHLGSLLDGLLPKLILCFDWLSTNGKGS